ncbi:MAG: Flavoredoxin [Bacteroidetes bacterium ADurb.Bin408]|nr:MAG: Flavoredoxin [Bacteroidetes bacterium ADurb.Bin408]
MKKMFFVIALLVLFINVNAQEKEGFKKITYKEFNAEAIKLIGDDWMLVAAGNFTNKFNMMTANWGGLGWLWNKPVAFIFVRPQRYTYEFTEREPIFTLTFFEEKYRDILSLLGSKSGRDMDKMKNSGLTPFETENKSIAFKEAQIILECKKIYATKINSADFTDKDIDNKVYPKKDYHTMYIGEITNIWVKNHE